ncbi:MAG: hypothetical protein GY801_18930 [bacterium]|nr:hypothetical protein [bacterium]
MIRWMTWLMVLSVWAGMLLLSGGTGRSTARAAEGGCGEDADGNPNLLTVYHSWDLRRPLLDDQEAEGPGALSHPGDFVLLEVCVPPEAENGVELEIHRGKDKVTLYKKINGLVPLGSEDLTFYSHEALGLKTSEVSGAVGDIEICAKTGGGGILNWLKGCEDWVKVTTMQVDLAIHHGNAAETEVAEHEEESRGAFASMLSHENEMKLLLTLKPKGLSYNVGLGELQENALLTIEPAVRLWDENGHLIAIPTSSEYEFPVSELDKILWIDPVQPSNQLKDIKIGLEYLESTDVVTATAILPEVDIREPARPYNRVGRDDPRKCDKEGDDDCEMLNMLWVWEDMGGHSIDLELIKTPDHQSPMWVQFEEAAIHLFGDPEMCAPTCFTDNLDYNVLSSELLETDEQTYSLVVPDDSDSQRWLAPDYRITYGIDYDGSGTLSGDDIKGEYLVFAVRSGEYVLAHSLFEIYAKGLSGLSSALLYRFWYGLFPIVLLPDDPGYGADAESRKIELYALERLTHHFGVRTDDFIDKGSILLQKHQGYSGKWNQRSVYDGQTYQRSYHELHVDLPIYDFGKESDASILIRDSEAFRSKITSFLKKRAIDAFIHAAPDPSDTTRLIEILFSDFDTQAKGALDIGFGVLNDIGLGWADLNPTPQKFPYATEALLPEGKITAKVTRGKEPDSAGGGYRYDISEIEVSAIVSDIWDYNYMKPFQVFSSSMSAVIHQCGFGKNEAFIPEGAGQAAFLRFEIEGTPKGLEMLSVK